MAALLEIKNICCRYERGDDDISGSEAAVEDFSLSLKDGALNCLLGPSGCGKTTVLRAVAGFEPLRGGEILLRGRCLSRPGLTLPPERRGVGMVFQDYALFPHLTVADNVGFGLRHPSQPGGGQRLSRSQQRQTVAEMLDLVDLSDAAARYPHELSGGEQQRVAVARALAPSPALLLMDEPFSNLDVDLRERLMLQVREILRQRGTTTLFVTHDQQEAFIIGEQIAVMKDGRIMQRDTPYRLYHEPACRFVADFIGQGRLLPGVLSGPQSVSTPLGELHGHPPQQSAGESAAPLAPLYKKGSPVDVLLRPDDVLLDGDNGIECRISDRHFKGAQIMYTLQAPGGAELLSLVGSHFDHAIGERVKVRVDARHLVMFPREA